MFLWQLFYCGLCPRSVHCCSLRDDTKRGWYHVALCNTLRTQQKVCRYMFVNCFIIGPGKRADSRFVPSRWETALHCNDVSHWLGTNLESVLRYWVVASLLSIGLQEQKSIKNLHQIDLKMTSTTRPWYINIWGHIWAMLTHWALGDLNEILEKPFSSQSLWLMAEILVKLPSGDCHWTLLMISEDWFR